jgi:hypothetical protein
MRRFADSSPHVVLRIESEYPILSRLDSCSHKSGSFINDRLESQKIVTDPASISLI